MTIGLDLGSYRLRSLRREGDQLVARSTHSFYSVLPDTDAHRALMQQAQIPFGVCEDDLVLMGNEAVDYAELFQVHAHRLLPGGIIPQADPLARQILGSLVDALLPASSEPGELCCLTLPGNYSQRPKSMNRVLEFFTRLVKLRGYTPQILSDGMAVILSELAAENFTGIGISFGAATCDVSLAHCGIQIAHCTIERGGHWIDQELARKAKIYKWDCRGDKYLDVNGCTQAKEQSDCSLTRVRDEDEKLLAGLYRDLVTSVLKQAAKAFANSPRLSDISQPIELVCAGGPTGIAGFEALLNHALSAAPPLPAIKDVRVTEDAQLTIARGCLISAELEAQTSSATRAAA